MKRFMVLLMLVSMCGCRLWHGSESSVAKQPEPILPPSARKMLTDARLDLYRGKPKDIEKAIKTADRVIKQSIDQHYIWEGWLVKANALELSDKNAEAADAAASGVDSVISQQAGALDDSTLIGAQMLLPVYVRNAVAQSGEKATGDKLEAWRSDLLKRLAQGEYKNEPTVRAVENQLKQMASLSAYYAAMLEPEMQVGRLLRQCIIFYNTRNSAALLKLAAPGSPISRIIEKNGAAGLTDKKIETLQLGGGVAVAFPEDKGNRPVASVTADLFAILPGGWTELAPNVKFTFVKNTEGIWLLTEINGLP